jgi:DNA-binding XRE family transcriptional regulator
MAYMKEISEDDLINLSFVREVRKGLKITQAELGAKSDNARQTITSIENNNTGTSWANALVILQRLGCRVIIECPELDRVYIVKGE